ncbi:hypothetical protein [Bacillus horti]|uniref:Uncharacterized protein n=1 Tax=Caldalkalibacillus horti TaxID=77523 RepID=A0ABT9W115_9BACI|nr:hypothetical protein [Bacillus horti]MDQ0166945.1 hypothetical protein [Bacillus horti]
MKKAPLETEEDLKLIKNFILLPILLDILERDTHLLQGASLKMVSVYVNILSYVQQQATVDLRTIRKGLYTRGLRVYEQSKNEVGVTVSYLCRGYHYQLSVMWTVVKAELQEKLSRYVEGWRSDL